MKSPESRYKNSLNHLALAEDYIPLGAQTVSKSKLTLFPGIAPLYGDRASGDRIWDVDGNEYVDLINSLAAVTLGHADTEITEAVTQQLSRGTTISLSHPIELEVAKRISGLVPSAEMVRFGKNGSDATSAAIRVARAYTGRDKVLVCGYHGWHDWYIGTTARGRGVPKGVSELATSVSYGDLETVENLLSSKEVAALIMEPMNYMWPSTGYLEGIRALCSKYGTLLIFDETITGFRLAPGGAQEYFQVFPDLSTFGKGLANGYPLSAVTGKREYMLLLEEVFFSGTFGGELLSLTAAKVVLERVKSGSVIPKLSEVGEDLANKVENLILVNGLSEYLKLSGHPSWKFLLWDPSLGSFIEELKALFMQEIMKNGVLMLATHNVSTALTSESISIVEKAYANTLPVIKLAIASKSVSGLLSIDKITPQLRVR